MVTEAPGMSSTFDRADMRHVDDSLQPKGCHSTAREGQYELENRHVFLALTELFKILGKVKRNSISWVSSNYSCLMVRRLPMPQWDKRAKSQKKINELDMQKTTHDMMDKSQQTHLHHF